MDFISLNKCCQALKYFGVMFILKNCFDWITTVDMYICKMLATKMVHFERIYLKL